MMLMFKIEDDNVVGKVEDINTIILPFYYEASKNLKKEP